MIPLDKNFRFRLPQELFARAEIKAQAEDLALAQVLRRLLSAWVNGEIEIPPYKKVSEEDRD